MSASRDAGEVDLAGAGADLAEGVPVCVPCAPAAFSPPLLPDEDAPGVAPPATRGFCVTDPVRGFAPSES